MSKEKTKSHFVGVRLTEEQKKALHNIQKHSELSKSDILLRGLEILSEYYALGLDKPPLSIELKKLEEEAIQHIKALKQIKQREESVKQMIQELREVDEIIDEYNGEKNALIQILLRIQEKKHWLPKPDLIWVSERLNIPMAQILQIATFYKAFSLEPRGEHTIRVCLGTACHVRGGTKILEATEQHLGVKSGGTTPDMKFTLESVNCLGCCALGPVMTIDNDYHGKLTPAQIKDVLSLYQKEKTVTNVEHEKRTPLAYKPTVTP
ncbi:MAG: NADH-quinone oxidoreductase subunit NuoE [Candidatus Thermoplasmatota archaeon]